MMVRRIPMMSPAWEEPYWLAGASVCTSLYCTVLTSGVAMEEAADSVTCPGVFSSFSLKLI